MFIKRAFTIIAVVLSVGQAAAQSTDDISKLSVDDLMNVEVTSVARRGQKLSETPAAVFVVTQEDIRRSGATTIPEILRTVPGLHVAQISGHVWAITARGFNGRYANKLLVLIDGRSVYSPINAGVDWDVQDTLLEDIDHIEVIRGPGGTLWGANAVSGVINIITRHSLETQGGIVTSGSGVTDRAFASSRYGGSVGHNLSYRIFAKSFHRTNTNDDIRDHSSDGSEAHRLGFRLDWNGRSGSTLLAEGEAYRGTADDTRAFNRDGTRNNSETALTGGNVLLRWTTTHSRTSETRVQAYLDYAHRSALAVETTTQAIDFDLQHETSAWTRQTIVWGTAWRRGSVQSAEGHELLVFTPSRQSTDLFSAFVQDEVRLSNNVRITLGSKIQYDARSQFQAQPTLRLLWRATPRNTFWAAATSAVRTPSIVEQSSALDFKFPTGPDQYGLIQLIGNPNLQPERVRTVEVGYRVQPMHRLSLDLTAFDSRYRGLIEEEQSQPRFVNGHLVIPRTFQNAGDAESSGLEAAAMLNVTRWWDLSASFTALRKFDLTHRFNSEVDEHGSTIDGPKRQAQLHSTLNLSPRFQIDNAVYYVGRLEAQNVPAYARFDMRLSWQSSRAFGISVAVRNLFDDRHQELNLEQSAGAQTSSNRSVNGMVTWRY
jgi:iron complex outermembrane receptor protein